MVELSIVLPFYNEEGNVEKAVGSLSKLFGSRGVDYELVCVENGSTDGTREKLLRIAKRNRHARLVLIDKNLGYGYGVRKGLATCRGKYLGWGWGDLQIKPEMFYKVFRALKDGNLDIAKIRRIKRFDGFSRKMQSFVFNNLFRLCFGVDFEDVNGCPKIMTRRFYSTAQLTADDWFIDSQIALHAKDTGAKWVELPTVFYNRQSGLSNYNMSLGLEFLSNIARYKLERIMRWLSSGK